MLIIEEEHTHKYFLSCGNLLHDGVVDMASLRC
jgi:hypothetical protein